MSEGFRSPELSPQKKPSLKKQALSVITSLGLSAGAIFGVHTAAKNIESSQNNSTEPVSTPVQEQAVDPPVSVEKSTPSPVRVRVGDKTYSTKPNIDFQGNPGLSDAEIKQAQATQAAMPTSTSTTETIVDRAPK